jgi:hypothetical protein
MPTEQHDLSMDTLKASRVLSQYGPTGNSTDTALPPEVLGKLKDEYDKKYGNVHVP